MNTFLNELKINDNFTYTENGAVTHKSTLNAVYDMFALGGGYRSRTEEDCIFLFKKALTENETLAMKCLFYLRDVRGGQGERRFFRVCFKWLAKTETSIARRNLENVAEYGRWDDLYCLVNTPLEKEAFALMKTQLEKDMESYSAGPNHGVSLLAKWLKSENASAGETKKLANKTRIAFGVSHKTYRQVLSKLRARIKIVETMMSQNRWEEIEFDKIPSKAGLVYRNAFARRDVIAEKYKAFMDSKTTKVNAGALYPYDIAHKAFEMFYGWGRVQEPALDAPERQALQKYWDALPNYFGDTEETGIAVVDVSGSMDGQPKEAAVSMGAYIANKARGPFANHFITFSSKPELVKFDGLDIVDKFKRAVGANWSQNTDLKAVFDLLLHTAMSNGVVAADMPSRLYIFSDMEFDGCLFPGSGYYSRTSKNEVLTLMERVQREWATYGYKLPDVIFWNLNARNDNIPAIGERFSCVSGYSPVLVECILSGKTGWDLCLDKLMSARYESVR